MSEKEKEKKQQKLRWLVGILMAGLMLLATLGYFAAEFFQGGFQDSTFQEQVIDGRTYLDFGDSWGHTFGTRTYYFFNLPNQIGNIFQGNVEFSDYNNRPLYLVNEKPEADFVLSNLAGYYRSVEKACLEDCPENFQIVDCSENVIVFQEDSFENTRVEQQENCLFIYGDFERGIDAISYSLLNIDF